MKPCPFCGNTDIEVDWGHKDDNPQFGSIDCQVCGAGMFHQAPASPNNKQILLDKWDRRDG